MPEVRAAGAEPGAEGAAQFDVFLSYNSRDRAIVERIAERFKRSGLEPWLDKWSQTPGGEWQEELGRGIEASRACAVFVGASDLGAWGLQELAFALDRSTRERDFRVFPVLLPGVREPFDPTVLPHFLRTRTWVDYRRGYGSERALRDLIAAVKGVPFGPSVAIEPWTGIRPYRGLQPFGEEDAKLFFGRDREVQRLVEMLKGGRFLAVVGASGSGKSSLVRAGLVPALRAGALPDVPGWTVCVLEPGADPLGILAARLVSLGNGEGMQATLDALRDDPRTLHLASALALSTRPNGERLLLVVDQLEETFTLASDEQALTSFFENLIFASSAAGGRCTVAVTLRSDFYPRLAAYAELAQQVSARQFLLTPMERDGLRQVIEEPARLAGLEFESGLVETVLDDVSRQPGALPLQEHALLELWERRRGRMLTLEGYRESGGVSGALATRAEAIYGGFDAEGKAVAKRVLLRLTQPGEGTEDTRRQATMNELVTRREEADALEEVVGELAHARMLTVGGEGPEEERRVDVSHEALIRGWQRLRGWVEDDRAGLQVHRRLREAAQEWQRLGRDEALVHRGAQLAEAVEWRKDHEAELNDVERAFLDDSRAASGRAQRRLRAGLGALAALLVLAVIAGLVALDERGKARHEVVASDAQRLGALALLEDDLDRALLLARQGVALDDTVQTRGNLLAALLKSPAAIGVIRTDTGRVQATALSPDGRTLAVGNTPGRILLFDARTRQRVATLRPTPKDADIFDLAYSPDGGRLAVGDADHRGRSGSFEVTVLDVRSRRSVADLTLPGKGTASGVQFSPDGRTIGIMTLSDRPRAAAAFTRFDASTGHRIFGPVRVSRRGFPSLMTTSDGRRMVVVGDGEITVRDATTLAVLRRFPGIGVSASLSSSDDWAYTGASSPYALSSDDHTLAVGDQNGSVRFVDLRNGKARTASGGHEAAVREARFAPDGRRLVTTSEDGEVIVWNVRSAAAAETLQGHAATAFSPQITPDGTTLFTARLDGTVFVWDLGGARPLGRPFRIGARPAIGPMLSSDGRLLATGRNDGAISIVETDTFKPHTPLQVAKTGPVWSIGFVPGSHRLVIGGRHGLAAFVDADRGRIVRRLRLGRGDIYGSVSATGRLLATVDTHTVRLWSPSEERPLGSPLRFTPAFPVSAQLSPDGHWLVIELADQAGRGGTLEKWDVRSRRVVARRRIEAPTAPAEFSPDGRLLAVAGATGRAQVWSVESWEPVTRWFAGHTDDVSGLAIGRDGRTLATGSFDGTVRLWDIETEQAIGAPLRGVPNRAVEPLLTPDGTRLIAAYETGEAYRWDIAPESLVRQACRVAGRRLTRAEWTEFLPGRDYDPAC